MPQVKVSETLRTKEKGEGKRGKFASHGAHGAPLLSNSARRSNGQKLKAAKKKKDRRQSGFQTGFQMMKKTTPLAGNVKGDLKKKTQPCK